VNVLEVLRRYALTDNFEEALRELSGFVDPFQLALMLRRLEEWGYDLEGFTLLKDPEFGEPLTVAVHVRGCGFDEWEAVDRRTKQWLLDQGLDELAGRTTVVCIDAFKPSYQSPAISAHRTSDP
jgi:hypothetical protein